MTYDRNPKQNDKGVKEQCLMSRSSEGHNVAYLLKDLDLGNNVCEYEVNQFTKEKLLEENETLTQNVNDAEQSTTHPDGISSENQAKNEII